VIAAYMVAGGLSLPARAAKVLRMSQDTNNQTPKNTASLAAEERIEKNFQAREDRNFRAQ
jgi:hypothetical protein